MAHAAVFDVDKNILRTGLGDRDLLVLYGTADLFDDLGPLFGRDLLRHFAVFDGCFGVGLECLSLDVVLEVALEVRLKGFEIV